MRFSSAAIAAIEDNVRKHVDMLAGVLGERNVARHHGALEAAARYIEDTFSAAGYTASAQRYDADGMPVRNIEAELVGSRHPQRIWIVGGHYDSVEGSPGADDNATAVAATLELARLLAADRRRDTIRFVSFVNEEPPYYKSSLMGSVRYAQRCRERNEDIRGMVNLEMLGFYDRSPGTQSYPHPLYRNPWRLFLPKRADFIAIVGNLPSFWLTRRTARLFRRSVKFKSVWVAAPTRIDGTGMSDHWSFWEQGYRAVMVTDTAFFRNPNYHKASDLPQTLDYAMMAQVVVGLAGVMAGLAG